MHELIILTIGLWIGGFVGVTIMCLLQVTNCDRCAERR